jgi:hypothetical protein
MVAGAVHATLERLERKGLLASGSAPERRFAAAAHAVTIACSPPGSERSKTRERRSIRSGMA